MIAAAGSPGSSLKSSKCAILTSFRYEWDLRYRPINSDLFEASRSFRITVLMSTLSPAMTMQKGAFLQGLMSGRYFLALRQAR